jgi:hypothetical protein
LTYYTLSKLLDRPLRVPLVSAHFQHSLFMLVTTAALDLSPPENIRSLIVENVGSTGLVTLEALHRFAL